MIFFKSKYAFYLMRMGEYELKHQKAKKCLNDRRSNFGRKNLTIRFKNKLIRFSYLSLNQNLA
jgi:hypothetical protein